jgi:hypothetical protein
MYYAVLHRQFRLVRRLENEDFLLSNYRWPYDIIEAAARSGDLDVFDYVCDHIWDSEEDYGSAALLAAIQEGHLNILEYILEYNLSAFDSSTYCIAAVNGRKAVMQWLLDQGVAHENSDVTTELAREGNLELLKWAVEKNFPLTQSAVEAAASAGFPRVSEWCKASGYLV